MLATPAMLGEALGNYRVTHKISEGGMGEVFAAEHVLIGRPAAIKVLRPELSSRRDMVERFFNEARATTAIRHPGIVEVLDFGFDPAGRAYLVMELLIGEPLSQRLGNGGVAVPVAVSLVRRVVQAVGAAHAKGIVHRDLKPDNVFLVGDPDVAFGIRPKVLDFGIAKLTGATSSLARTQTGALMGTPRYMSPEQCRGAGVVDHRTDFYAIGCILYELIARRPPFLVEGFGEIIAAHLTSSPPPLSPLVATVPPGLEEVVMRCLAKSPDDRYGSAEELVAALDAVTGTTSHTPVPPPAVWAMPGRPTSPPGVPTTLGGAAAETAGVRHSARWPWLAAAVVALGAAGGFAVLRGGVLGDGPAKPPAAAAQPRGEPAPPPPPPAPPPEVKSAPETAPAPEARPTTAVTPAADAEPATAATPPADAEPATAATPTAGARPTTAATPATAVTPPADAKPTTAATPTADAEPATAATPTTGARPTTAATPATAATPTADARPTTTADTKPATEVNPTPKPRDKPRRTPHKEPAKPPGLETDL